MQPLITHPDLYARPEVMRTRRVYGILYGCAVALAFAAWTWGFDGYLLYKAHAMHPWFKLILGMLVCLPAGGAAGWVVMRFEKGLISAAAWLGAALVFAWMSVAMPFLYSPQWVMAMSKAPVQIPAEIYPSLFARLGLAFTWVAIFVLVAGLLEMPMGESAVFSTTLLGKIGPSLVCVALMGISGFMVDGLGNQPLRDPLLLTDSTVQFMADTQGKQIDAATSRARHLAGLRSITDIIGEPRQLTIGAFEPDLGEIHVLVKFNDQWVDCLTVYNQMSGCQKITP